MCFLRYELGTYILEDGILHCHFRGNLKPFTVDIIVHDSYLLSDYARIFRTNSNAL
jgi:hypothetical protein